MDSAVKSFVSSIQIDSLGGVYPEAIVSQVAPGLVKVMLRFQLKDSVSEHIIEKRETEFCERAVNILKSIVIFLIFLILLFIIRKY